MHTEAMAALAAQIGFEHWAPVSPQTLEVLDEVRAMCSADRCKRYGHSWSCPPYCGTLDALSREMRTFTAGLLVQTTVQMRDAFDMEAIRAADRRHKQRFETLLRQLRLTGLRMMPMGSGSCTRCRVCTCPDQPCRYPERLYPSMEACGLQVSRTCEAAGLAYNHGENTMTYTACVLFDEE